MFSWLYLMLDHNLVARISFWLQSCFILLVFNVALVCFLWKQSLWMSFDFLCRHEKYWQMFQIKTLSLNGEFYLMTTLTFFSLILNFIEQVPKDIITSTLFIGWYLWSSAKQKNSKWLLGERSPVMADTAYLYMK
jgi:hypothetical protein